MLRRTLLAGLTVFSLAATANAGTVYVVMMLDPGTTAGSGVSTTPRQFSSGTFSVTSNKSGLGSWHLYALDDLTGSLGIAGFSVNMTATGGGALSSIQNRSPNATYTNYGDADETVIDSSGSAGFSDNLVRSGVGANPTNPVQGNQVIGSLNDIIGYGQTANNFNNTPNNPAPGDHRTWGGVVSGQWGTYATSPSNVQLNLAGLPGAAAAQSAGKKWVLLGEGNYTGGTPQFSSIIANYYDSTNGGILHQQTAGPANGNGIQAAVIPAVPEPASFALLGIAMVALGYIRRRG